MVLSPLTIPLRFSNVLRLRVSQFVLRCRANSAVNELLVLCSPFSIAERIFCVRRSDRKVCTSIAGGCTIAGAGPVECKCNEEIVFCVSEGFNPDDARRKLLQLDMVVVRSTLVACFLFLLRRLDGTCLALFRGSYPNSTQVWEVLRFPLESFHSASDFVGLCRVDGEWRHLLPSPPRRRRGRRWW